MRSLAALKSKPAKTASGAGISLTGYGSIEHAVAAIKAGAIDYITKPVRPEQLELAVNQALEVVRLRRENERLRREVMEFRNERQIIGDSPAIRRVRLVRRGVSAGRRASTSDTRT